MRKLLLSLFVVLFVAVLFVGSAIAQYPPSAYPMATRHSVYTPHPYYQPTPRPICIITDTYYNCGGSVWGSSEPLPDVTENTSNTFSILIPAEDGFYLLEIQDSFGNWSLVTDVQHPDGLVFEARNGYIELIGSVGQDFDPGHYRTIEVNP